MPRMLLQIGDHVASMDLTDTAMLNDDAIILEQLKPALSVLLGSVYPERILARVQVFSEELNEDNED